MDQETILQQVAEQAGLTKTYVSAWGSEATVSNETQRKVLAGLGYDTSSDDALLASAEKMHKQNVLPFVKVAKQGESIEIGLQLGASARLNEFSWVLTTEDGQVFEGWLESEVVRDDRADGGELIIALPANLPLGYHELKLNRKRRKTPYIMPLIVAPKACYKQPELHDGKKMWGPSVQLYTLRTEQNWGIGDFGDLKQLAGDIAQRGADFIGLNPIHSLFSAYPESASPYSPSSRVWLNTIYIDAGAVPEFAQCEEAQQLVGSSEFQQQLAEARALEYVDYTKVSTLKMQVLNMLFTVFNEKHLKANTQRGQAFYDFVSQGGESLKAQATFDALHNEFAQQQQDECVWGYPVFPEKYRQYTSAAVKKFVRENPEKVEFYMYLQWIALSQLKEAQDFATEKGMSVGLYRDLAVGVSEGGAEAWSDDGNLCMDLCVGAPPDVLGPLGQNWGLPPLNPLMLQKKAYSAYIELLRANMRNCGALRIDHVLGLLRLWMIPRGEGATEGAYVYYPVEDMLSILALESHRYQCSIIGEDLGTVPDEIVSILADAGVHSYKVFFFETAEDGGFISPVDYTAQSMTALSTHDMPTIKGFWHCEDLQMGRELGLYPNEEQLHELYEDRAKSKQRMLESMHWHGYLSEGIGYDAAVLPMTQDLNYGMHLHVAAGSSALLSVQLEDFLEMDKPVNIPGTVDEYPNWRRKLSANLDDIFSRDDINALAHNLTEIRQKASNK